VTLRLTPARFALSYISLGVIALALLAVPLWYGFQANLGTFRSYIPAAEMQGFVDTFHRDGPKAVEAAVDAYAKTLPPDQVALFVDPQKKRLAGNLPRWPAGVPDVPGTYGLVLERGGYAPTRVIVSHVSLPGGYVLLMGRESVIFDSLVARFWFGIAGAIAILLSLGLLFGWLLRRAHGQLEELVEQRTAELRQAQRLEAMGTLAGGIAHDFNNILGAILGFGEMAMRDVAKDSRLWRDLDSIMEAGERGRVLVDRVLAFSRSSVGERVPVHVEKVVREALDQLSAKLPPDITLHFKLHAGRAAMQGDATQVHQVLTNLATNAIQSMTGGGTLRVSLRVERIEQARAPTIGNLVSGEYFVLQVADAGAGISADVLEHMFDPFFTTKEVGTGTGLGLSIVHGIVTELGGAIDVATTVGKGSTFTIYLPRAGDAVEADPDEKPSLPRGDGQRVLVVDDEEPLVRLATRTLEELGYVPVGFTSSSAALAAFRADPHQYDAVVTDERMPGISGSALIREVRGIRDGIPVVLMSGYVGDAVARQARDAGVEEVLRKPLSAHDLAVSLARVLHA
jgi:signal transduction histidine kinase